MTIGAWLSEATDELVQAGIDSARLDAEIILAHTLKKPRTYVHAHPSDQIEPRLEDVATARLDLRLNRTPLAYIVGHKEFYGHLFSITPQVLVPRPESEQVITLLRKTLPPTAPLPGVATKRLVDIGTGSGILGITAKLLYPELDVTLIDTSRSALGVAEKNAELLGADVATMQSDLLLGYPFSPDIVLANLPYVDENWEHSPEIEQEPAEALFADNNGLSVINRCLEQLSTRLKPDAVVIFEADPRQWDDIISRAQALSFDATERDEFAVAFIKKSA